MHTQFALSQLYPLSENIVVIIYFVGQFCHITVSFRPHCIALFVIAQSVHFVYYPVNEWHYAVNEEYLCPVLKVSLPVSCYVRYVKFISLVYFLIFLIQSIVGRHVVLSPLLKRLEQSVKRTVLLLLTAQIIENQHHCNSYGNHKQHRAYHQIELSCRLAELFCSSLEMPVLSRHVLQVKIDVPVIVTTWLIVHCRIHE